MLADPAFREQVCAAMRVDPARRHRRRRTAPACGSSSTRPSRPTGIPSFAKKFVGDEIQIVQREEWRSATSAVAARGDPRQARHLNGTITLAADGDRTVETVAGDIKVKVPLIGGKLEGLVGRPAQLARCGPRSGSGGPGWPATR